MRFRDAYFIERVYNMDITAITQLISTLGFPVACVCYLFYAQAKEREEHAKEAKAWTDALHNNTLAIQHLTDVIGGLAHDKQ